MARDGYVDGRHPAAGDVIVPPSASRIGGRAAVAIVAVLIGALFMASTLPTPLYPIYERAFGFSRVTLTLIYAVYVVGNLAALLFFGRTSDTMGRRPVSLAAIASAGASTLIFLFASGTPWLFWARMLNGFGIGLAAGAATAWIAELAHDPERSRAPLIATSSNFFGLAVGALLAGMLAQYAPWPLHLPFVVHLILLLVLTLLVARTKETVERPVRSLDPLRRRPRLGVPRTIRTAFVAPAVAVFGAMALVGFYAALIPSVLAESLGETSHAVAGIVVFELTLIVAVTIILTRRLHSRAAMLRGLVLMLPSLALLVAAQALGSMAILVAGTAVSGVSAALGYRGSLQVVNQIAPADRRAEVVSAYFVAGFTGNAVPVIGIGTLSEAWSPTAASAVFALTIGAFALVALAVGARCAPRQAA